MLATTKRQFKAAAALAMLAVVSTPAMAVEAPPELLGTWGPVNGFDAATAVCDHVNRLEVWTRNTEANASCSSVSGENVALYIEIPARGAAMRIFDVKPAPNGWQLYFKDPSAPDGLRPKQFSLSDGVLLETEEFLRPNRFGRCQ